MNRYSFAALALALFAAPLAAAEPAHAPPLPQPSHAVRTLDDATAVLDDLAALPLKGIPPKLLADAQAVVIVPRVVKLGFVVGARGGHGVALARAKDGTWSDPVFVHFGGASVGFQAGVESTDVVLVFRTRKSLDRVLDGKDKLTLGADASVAAGPVGRAALAATDAQLGAEVLSYSRARGLFAGIAVDGAVIRPDAETTAAFQSAGTTDRNAAEQLKLKLTTMSAPAVAPAAPLPPAVTPPTAPRRPRIRPFGMWRRGP